MLERAREGVSLILPPPLAPDDGGGLFAVARGNVGEGPGGLELGRGGGNKNEGNFDEDYWRNEPNNLKLQTKNNHKHEQPTLKLSKNSYWEGGMWQLNMTTIRERE